MKNINIILFIWAILPILFISCDKENEGTLFSNGQANKATFLTKSGNWDLKDATFKVKVGRTSTAGEYTVPVKLTAAAANKGYTDVFSISSPAKFAEGAEFAEVTLSMGDVSTINPASLSIIPNGTDVNVGLSYPFTLTIDSAAVAYANVASFSVSTSNNLEFESIGNGTIDSSGGWEEDIIENVKIEKAKGAEVYKVVQPYGFGSIAFMILADGKTVNFPNQIIATDATYGAVTMGSVKGVYNEEDNTVTLNVGGYTVSAGSFGGGVEIIHLP